MKYSFLNLTLLMCTSFTLVFTSCKTDFDVTGDYQVTPIVFGLLDQNEEYHYIRINKTFLGQGNAFDFAQVPDSSYFNSVEATITEVLSNGTTGRIWELRDTLLSNKNENGVFYAPEHKLYYFKTDNENGPLINDAKYKFYANINNKQHEVTGETELVRDILINTPTAQSTINMKGNQPGDYKGFPIAFSKGNAASYNVKVEFHYNEFTNSEPTAKYFSWNLAEITSVSSSGQSISVTAPGEQFYELIKSKIAQNSSLDKREHTAFKIILTAGSADLANYMLAVKPSSSLAQSKPSYTNLKGGIGLFSSRLVINYTKLFKDPLNQNWRSLDKFSTRELCEGPYTFELGFCSTHPADQSESFKCN
jgi:hypothetical protein